MIRAALILSAAAACGSSSAASSSAPAVQVHAWKPQHASAMTLARVTMDHLGHDPSGPRPDWVLYDPKGDQIVFVGADAGYQRALEIAKTYDVETPVPAPAPARYAGGAAAADPWQTYVPTPAVVAITGVTKVDDTSYVLDRSLVDKVLADPMSVAAGARVVPAIKSGAPYGFKLYAIRPSSLYAALGFQNGDTIRAINGLDVSTPDKALEVYTQIKSASSLDVSITRRGTDLVLHYSIK